MVNSKSWVKRVLDCIYLGRKSGWGLVKKLYQFLGTGGGITGTCVLWIVAGGSFESLDIFKTYYNLA